MLQYIPVGAHIRAQDNFYSAEDDPACTRWPSGRVLGHALDDGVDRRAVAGRVLVLDMGDELRPRERGRAVVHESPGALQQDLPRRSLVDATSQSASHSVHDMPWLFVGNVARQPPILPQAIKSVMIS